MSLPSKDPRIKGTSESLARAVLSTTPLAPLLNLEELRRGVLQGFAKKKEQDLDAFLSELARRAQDDGRSFAQDFIDQVLAEREIDQVLAQAIHAALEITDGEFLAALAHVTYFYRINQKAPDLFYRSFVELLHRIGNKEFQALKDLLRTCIEISADQPNSGIHSYGIETDDKTGHAMAPPKIKVNGDPAASKAMSINVPESLWDILAGLGLLRIGSGWGGTVSISLHVSTARELSHFILGQDPGELGAPR